MESDLEEQVIILGSDSNGHRFKNVHMNMCLIVNGYRDKVVRIFRHTSIRGLSIKRKVFERNMDTPDELLARIFGSAARVKERENQPKLITRELPSALTVTVGCSPV
jgi:hypothetical protein